MSQTLDIRMPICTSLVNILCTLELFVTLEATETGHHNDEVVGLPYLRYIACGC